MNTTANKILTGAFLFAVVSASATLLAFWVFRLINPEPGIDTSVAFAIGCGVTHGMYALRRHLEQPKLA